MRNLIQQRGRPIIVSGQPVFAKPDSQLVSASQIYEPSCRKWFDRLGFPLGLDRKRWEYSYILHAVYSYGKTGEGARGIVFGCGKEQLTSIFASEGAEIVATDYVVDSAHGWEAQGMEDLYCEQHLSREEFDARVSFLHVDMNEIPTDLRDFDFCWSTGSLEHIGSHANGMAFVEKAMECLKPGGIAVHTTEFTVTSETIGQDFGELSFYCRADIEALADRLTGAGHQIVLNFDRGNTVADTHVDTPPYHGGRTLLAHFDAHIITSIGLIIQKAL
jgi:SAM-dependent methyltransferase